MNWRAAIVGILLALGGAVGCQKCCYLTEKDAHAVNQIPLPPNLECDPSASCVPVTGVVPPPTTVEDTRRKPRYLSLREAIAIALENGTVGSQSPTSPGLASDSLSGFQGTGVAGPDGIRVLALDPAIVATNIEAALSKFDVQWNNSLTWTKSETPLGTNATNFQAGLTPGATLPFEAINTDAVSFNSALIKPLPTGGVAGITFITNYSRSNTNSAVNPAYQPAIQFNFEQPLLQGFGVEINQLRPSHPGSLLTPFQTATGVEGILITRIRLDEQRLEFQRNVNFLLLNVESAYWNLYGSYYQLYSQEESMRLSFEVWRLNKLSFDAGRIPRQKLEQARVQYEIFRGNRLTALAQIQENERNLRGLLNLPVEDGQRLVPTDAPPLVPFAPDWNTALNDALALRPELILARQELKFRQLDLIRVKDGTRPDLRFTMTDNLHSLGSQLDGGPVPQNALHELVTDPFNTLALGLQMNVPLGFRGANAQVRSAQLLLARSYESLRIDEEKAQRVLGLSYRQIYEFWSQIEIQRAAVRSAQQEVQDYLEQIRVGRATYADTDLFLAERDLDNSQVSLYQAISQYATALASFQFARGTIMQHDSVFIAEGPLPQAVQVRAVEHERQRTKALVLRERQQGPILPVGAPAEANPLLQPPSTDPVPVPVLFRNRPPIPTLPAKTQEDGKAVAEKGRSGSRPARLDFEEASPANEDAEKVSRKPAPSVSFEEAAPSP